MKIQIFKNVFTLGLLLFGAFTQKQNVSGTVLHANSPLLGASISEIV